MLNVEAEALKKRVDFLKNELIPALRSGRYSQCQGQYFDGESCCVLGLVRKLVDPEGKSTFHKVFTDLGLYDKPLRQNLLILNDYKGKSFPEIADWLENFLKETEAIDENPE